MMAMAFVEFENVSKIYKTGEVEISALHGASFTVERGELAIWDFANNENIYTAKRAGVVRGSDSHRKWNEYRRARNEAERRRLDGGRR